MKYAQANLDRSDDIDLEADRAEYEADRARDLYLNGEHGIDEVMNTLELDALLFPGRAARAFGPAGISDGDRPVRRPGRRWPAHARRV